MLVTAVVVMGVLTLIGLVFFLYLRLGVKLAEQRSGPNANIPVSQQEEAARLMASDDSFTHHHP